MDIDHTALWIALAQIIGVNLVLSGDNAVVIALAARTLPPRQQKQAIFWGSGAAVGLRVVLTVAALRLLRLPYLKLAGAVLLLWIGIKLLLPEGEDAGAGTGAGGTDLFGAIRTILVADLVMSLDNVIAVAAAAHGSLVLLVVGLAISIPLVVLGSTLLLRIMQRFPAVITLGAGLLGWVAGDMAFSDELIRDDLEAHLAWLHGALPTLGAVLVVAMGTWLGRRRRRAGAPASEPDCDRRAP